MAPKVKDNEIGLTRQNTIGDEGERTLSDSNEALINHEPSDYLVSSLEQKTPLNTETELNPLEGNCEQTLEGQNKTANDEEAEKRRLRRQELLERQKSMSQLKTSKPWKVDSEGSPNGSQELFGDLVQYPEGKNSTTTSLQIRETLVENAIKFLADPKIKSHPLDKKLAFLESKGLHPEEIKLAFQRSKTSESSLLKSNAGPPLPPRLYKFTPPKPIVLPRPSLPFVWRQLGLIVFLLSSGGLLLAFLFKKIAIPALVKIFKGRCYILNKRKRQFIQFLEDCEDHKEKCRQYIVEKQEKVSMGNLSSNLPTEDNFCKKLAYDMMHEFELIKRQIHALDAYRSKIVSRTSSLAREISGLFTYYFHQLPDPSGDPMFWNRGDSPVAGLKSEIRSLKGILLRSNSKSFLSSEYF